MRKRQTSTARKGKALAEHGKGQGSGSFFLPFF
jgi:hypothetical protein